MFAGLRGMARRAVAAHRLAPAAATTTTRTATARCFSTSDGGKGRYEKDVTADARKGRDGAWSLEQMIKQEFQGDAAQALGKSGDKVSRALADLAAAGSARANATAAGWAADDRQNASNPRGWRGATGVVHTQAFRLGVRNEAPPAAAVRAAQLAEERDRRAESDDEDDDTDESESESHRAIATM